MKTYHDANKVKKQPTKPCEDCPFRRVSIPGWLGQATPAEYCSMAHSEDVIQCHTKLIKDSPAQCAGAAIYRANVVKRCEPPSLMLPKDRDIVFATPIEFLEHHCQRKLTTKQVQKMFAAVLDRRIREAQELLTGKEG